MNILIVTLSPIEALTSSMFRTLALARGLAQNGNIVDLLCVPMGGTQVAASKKDFVADLHIIRTSRNQIYAKTIDNNKTGKISSIIKTTLRWIWHKTSIFDNTIFIANKIDISMIPQREYDLVISSSDPKSSHIATKNLIKQGMKYKKWIEYWGDPLVLDITIQTILPKFALKVLENRIIRDCNKIVYVSPITYQAQLKMFPKQASKMAFLPVPYMEEEMYGERKNKRFVIGYYGSYATKVRNILPFYDACVDLHEMVDTAIYGDSDIELKETENVKIYPRGIVDEHKRTADLEVCILNSSGTQIPGKISHLAGSNKKVLVILDGEYADAIKEYLLPFGRFYMCENRKEAIISKIKEIISDKSCFEPVKDFHYSAVARKFLSLC